MTYVDGYILAVPTENLGAYRDMADKAGKIWMEHGALEYKECVAEDIEDKGFYRTFQSTMDLRKGESAIFSYIVFKSREHRDEVNAKVMSDPRIKESCAESSMPFDSNRMTYGGFTTIVEY